MLDFITDGAFTKNVRIRTGLTSFDLAMSNSKEIGMPIGQIYEIYGENGIGKSTFSYYLAVQSSMKDPNRKPVVDDEFKKNRKEYPYIILCDVEGLNINYISQTFESAGFRGTVRLIPQYNKNKMLTHSQMLDLAIELYEEEGNVLILDSVGAIVADSELNSDLADANMGNRARLISKFLKRINTIRLVKQTATIFLINHVFTSMGTPFPTKETAGGRTIRYLASARIYLTKGDAWMSKGQLRATVVKGKVEKLRDGGMGDQFYFVTIPDFGVSKNLTAVVDCLNLFSDEFSLSDSGTLRYKSESLGNINKLIDAELEGNQEKFDMFHERLTLLSAPQLREELTNESEQ